MRQRLLLLDLDGTIREPASGARFISEPSDQRLIEGALLQLRRYKGDGWTMVGITNQGGVASGHKTMGDAIEEQWLTLMACRGLLSEIYFCPEYDGSECICVDGEQRLNYRRFSRTNQSFRKPGAGMLELAMELNSFSREKTMMVGDRSEDEESAKNAGVAFQWAKTWLADTGIYIV